MDRACLVAQVLKPQPSLVAKATDSKGKIDFDVVKLYHRGMTYVY